MKVSNRRDYRHLKEDKRDFITLGGKRYPLNQAKYDPHMSADEISKAFEEEEAQKKAEEELNKRLQPIIDRNKEIFDSGLTDKEKFEKLFDLYVPNEGPADTLGGEILRAVNRLNYTWYNDEYVCFLGYGAEHSCGMAACFLMNIPYKYKEDFLKEFSVFVNANIKDMCKDIKDDDHTPIDEIYPDFLTSLITRTIELCEENPIIFDMHNDSDMLEEDDIGNYVDVPTYTYTLYLDNSLYCFIDNGIISHYDVEDRIENILSTLGIPYESLFLESDYVDIKGLDYDCYQEIRRGIVENHLGKYERELRHEFGDIDEDY